MGNNTAILLSGKNCSCALTPEAITVNGKYYRYDIHKRRPASGQITIDLLEIMRVGFAKTYSRTVFLFPMCFGFAALLIKAIPSIGYEKEIIKDVYSVGFTLWSVPFQDVAWKLCAALCLLTIPLYWLSYRNDLEINTTKGRFLLQRTGMDTAQISAFQREFTQLKEERRKLKKSI